MVVVSKFADSRRNVSNAICALCHLIEIVWVNVNYALKVVVAWRER